MEVESQAKCLILILQMVELGTMNQILEMPHKLMEMIAKMTTLEKYIRLSASSPSPSDIKVIFVNIARRSTLITKRTSSSI